MIINRKQLNEVISKLPENNVTRVRVTDRQGRIYSVERGVVEEDGSLMVKIVIPDQRMF